MNPFPLTLFHMTDFVISGQFKGTAGGKGFDIPHHPGKAKVATLGKNPGSGRVFVVT
jgi:hypothetical protein